MPVNFIVSSHREMVSEFTSPMPHRANTSMRANQMLKAAQAEAAAAASPIRMPPATAPPAMRGAEQKPDDTQPVQGVRLFHDQVSDDGEPDSPDPGSNNPKPPPHPYSVPPMSTGRELQYAGSKASRLQ
eukprot:scaffold676601_cov39-Prasinocladus_malaysianus.AAC.1